MHIKYLISQRKNKYYNKCDLMLFLWASRETSYLNKLLCMPQLKHMNYFEQICIDLQLTLD